MNNPLIPTLREMAEFANAAVTTLDGDADVVAVDFYDYTTDGVDYPKSEYPNGAMVVRKVNHDIELVSVLRQNADGSFRMGTRNPQTEYDFAFMQINRNPFA